MRGENNTSVTVSAKVGKPSISIIIEHDEDDYDHAISSVANLTSGQALALIELLKEAVIKSTLPFKLKKQVMRDSQDKE